MNIIMYIIDTGQIIIQTISTGDEGGMFTTTLSTRTTLYINISEKLVIFEGDLFYCKFLESSETLYIV